MSLRIEYSERPSSHWIKPASETWSWFPAEGVHISHQKTDLPFRNGESGLPWWFSGKASWLPIQGTWIWSLVQKDPTCCRATKPTAHNCWAQVPQPLRLCPRAVLHNKRSHCNGKLTQLLIESRPAHHIEKKPYSNKDPVQPKLNKLIKLLLKKKQWWVLPPVPSHFYSLAQTIFIYFAFLNSLL